jgi:nitrate/nitrite transport system permease protein
MTIPITSNERSFVVDDDEEIDEAFKQRRTPLLIKYNAQVSAFFATLLPPAITLLVLLLVWQLFCIKPTSALPSPSRIWAEANDLILHPFFENGSQDIGLGWRVLTSLKRVAVGFGLASVAGILVGAFIGQSKWATRGLDPLFQVLRTVPPLAWLPISLAAFRDSQPSAIFVIFITSIWPVIINTAVGIRNIPQDYRNVAAVLRLNQLEFFWKIMIPSAAPYIFTGLRIGVGLSWLAIVAASSSGTPGTRRVSPTSLSPSPTSASRASCWIVLSPRSEIWRPAARKRARGGER